TAPSGGPLKPAVRAWPPAWQCVRTTSTWLARSTGSLVNFMRLKREGYDPNRDLTIMLTGNEETTGARATLLATEHRRHGCASLSSPRPAAFEAHTEMAVEVDNGEV